MATSAPEALQYLTVQDILWLNLQVTKQTNAFDFAMLEEATFYQYGYGGSKDVMAQASRFLNGFIAKNPFGGKGDAATAFLGCAAFLRVNGYELNVPAGEAKAWLERIALKQVDSTQAIGQLAQPSAHHEPSIEACLRAVADEYAAAFS